VDYYFNDSLSKKPDNLITIDSTLNSDVKRFEFIETPSIIDIVDQILHAIQVTDKALSNNYELMKVELQKYESELP
jgi:hypothetical protein